MNSYELLIFREKVLQKAKFIESHAKIIQLERKKIERELIYGKVETSRNKMASMRVK